MVVIPIREDTSAAALRVPIDLRGAWVDALNGATRELEGEMMVDDLTWPLPLALLERAG